MPTEITRSSVRLSKSESACLDEGDIARYERHLASARYHARQILARHPRLKADAIRRGVKMSARPEIDILSFDRVVLEVVR